MKNSAFILGLLFSTVAYANAGHFWFSVQENHVQNAICRTSSPGTYSEVMSYFRSLERSESLLSQDITDKEVRGVLFQEERPSLVYAFAELTSFTSVNASGQVTKTYPEKKLQVPRSCSKVLCAVEHLFGAKNGPLILFLMHKYSLNAAPGAFEQAGAWTEQELTSLLKALQLIPEHLKTSFRLNQQLSRVHGGTPYGNASVLADSQMRFYDPWINHSAATQQAIALHEFAHIFALTITTLKAEYITHDEGQIWAKLFGQTPPRSFVSQYSQTNQFEDFAESLVAYRLNPRQLFRSSPEKYSYLKTHIFGGIEYTSQEKCENKEFSLEEPRLSPRSKEDIFNDCKVFVGANLRHLNSYKTCVNHRALRQYYIELGYEPGFFPAYSVDRQSWSGKITFPKLAKELAERQRAEMSHRFHSAKADAEYQRFIDAL